MVFSSYLFLFFFLPLALVFYYVSPGKWKHLVLTVFSYVVYGWANPSFMLLMLFTTTVDYTNGRLMELRTKRKKLWVTLSIAVDLYRKAMKNPEWLKNKKFVIWVFTAREFTEAANGWARVPVIQK